MDRTERNQRNLEEARRQLRENPGPGFAASLNQIIIGAVFVIVSVVVLRFIL